MTINWRVREEDLSSKFTVNIGMLTAERSGPAWQGWSGNDPTQAGRGWNPDGQFSNSQAVTARVGTGVYRRTFDINNGRPRHGRSYRVGGPFFSAKHETPDYVSGHISCRGPNVWPPAEVSPHWEVAPYENWFIRYSGGFANPAVHLNGVHYTQLDGAKQLAVPLSPDDETDTNPDDLSHLGSRAYRATRPKDAEAGLMQTIIEMRDFPQQLRQTAELAKRVYEQHNRFHRRRRRSRRGDPMTPQELADINLLTNFGWIPLIDDLRKTIDVIRDFDVLVEKRKRQMKKVTKRVFREDELNSSHVLGHESSSIHNFCEPNFSSTGHPWLNLFSGGSMTISLQNMQRVWYEGAYKVNWPEFGTDARDTATELNQLRRLLGIRLDPVTLWKVTPWTWLLDWFVNVSDNIQRYQDMLTDEVANMYLYIMRHTYSRYEFKVQVNSRYGGGSADCTWYKSVEVKRRIEAANTFGWSPRPGGLSGFQQGILGSLGIKRLRR